MRMHKRIKDFLASARLRRSGSFPYFGSRIYSPADSLIFRRVRSEGVFERETCYYLMKAAAGASWYFDVGANLGLMSIPLLRKHPGLKVVSLEPSPNSLPYLQKTHATSVFTKRWHIVPKAASDVDGMADFSLSSEGQSAFEGLRHTGRAPLSRTHKVETQRLDGIWETFSRPRVSLVKIDVEGAERAVLEGAGEMLRQCRPVVVLEWVPENLQGYEVDPLWLLGFARDAGFRLYDLSTLAPIVEGDHLLHLLHQGRENFVLYPRTP